MIVRDLDVLQRAASRADVSVNFSVPTLDSDDLALHGARHRAARSSGCGRCARSSTRGIRPASAWRRSCPACRTSRSCWPTSSGRRATHGATHVWANVLYLRPGTREHFLDKLAQVWPELIPSLRALYSGRAYLPKSEVEPRRSQVQALAHRFGVEDRRVLRIAPAPEAPPPNEQLTLILSTDAEAVRSRAA